MSYSKDASGLSGLRIEGEKFDVQTRFALVEAAAKSFRWAKIDAIQVEASMRLLIG